MQIFTIFLLLLVSISTYAHDFSKSLTMVKQAKVDAANIYADGLLDEFDRLLKEQYVFKARGSSPLLSDVYAELIAARQYIEQFGVEPSQYGEKSLVLAYDMNAYFEVMSEIKYAASLIKFEQTKLNKQDQALVLYPSVGPDGNVTGNTFPENVWSLTYDDGPHDTRTKEVVDNLYLHGQKATFFVLMRQVNSYPHAIEYLLNSDMELALHSYNHLNLNNESQEVMDYEISQSKKELEEKFEKKITLFRLPYGSGLRNTTLRQKIVDDKMMHIFWNVDTLDWKDKDPESIFERVKLQMELTPNRSGIILFHDIHAQTVIASEMVMNYLNEQQKKVCLVGEVINYINGQTQSCL